MTKHRGTVIRKPQWWKHLRDWKRVFWKRDRAAGKAEARKEEEQWTRLCRRNLRRWMDENPY